MKKLFFALMMGLAFAACTPETYDDSALKEQINNLDERLTKVEEALATLELNVNGMKTLAEALKNGKFINSVQELSDKTGYTITFSDGTSIVIKHGEKGQTGATGAAGATGATGATGAAGKDGVTPTITVKEVDGVLYWFINGQQGPSVYEAAPVFTCVDGILYVTYPGQEPQPIGALTGKSIFDSVNVNEAEGTVTFFLLGENGQAGDSFVLPLAAKFELVIDTKVSLASGATSVEIPYEVKGANATTVVDVLTVACDAVVEAEVIKVSNIAAGAQILVFADNGEGKTSIKKIVFEDESFSVEEVDDVIPAEGGQVVVKGVSNIAFDLVVSAAWLTQVETKTAFELVFAAEANTVAEVRTAEISFVRKGTEEVLKTVTVAQAAAEVAKELELKRVWGKYATTADGWIVMGAGNLDRGMAMDNQYIYVSKSTAYAPVIKAFDFAGNEAFEVNVTGMGSGNAWGDAMQYSVNCVRTMPKADGSYVLIACNLKMDASHVLEIWAWVDGPQAAPTCIGRYAYDSVANASDHRRYGDRFDVKGTWEDGELWFPSMQADDHGKCVVFKTFSGVDNANRPHKYYRMEPSQSNMKDLAFYPGYEEVLSSCNGIAKFVKLDGTTHSATGWINWAVTADYSSTHATTFGYNFFEVDGKKYIAYVKIDKANGRTGRLVVIEDETSDFKAALTANKVAYEFPLQHESDLTAESAAVTGNTLGNCKVVTVDGVTYIGAHVQGLGCSLFKFE